MTLNLYINQQGKIKKLPPPLSNPYLPTAINCGLVFLCAHTELQQGKYLRFSAHHTGS